MIISRLLFSMVKRIVLDKLYVRMASSKWDRVISRVHTNRYFTWRGFICRSRGTGMSRPTRSTARCNFQLKCISRRGETDRGRKGSELFRPGVATERESRACPKSGQVRSSSVSVTQSKERCKDCPLDSLGSVMSFPDNNPFSNKICKIALYHFYDIKLKLRGSIMKVDRSQCIVLLSYMFLSPFLYNFL